MDKFYAVPKYSSYMGPSTAAKRHIPALEAPQEWQQMELHSPSMLGIRYVMCVQVNAELIVTFEGTTEFGNPFMARQSYLPTEIHWGHKFVPILSKPPPGQTRYQVDISRQASGCSMALFLGHVCLSIKVQTSRLARLCAKWT